MRDVDATADPVQVWGSVQSPNDTRRYVAEALEIRDDEGNPDASKVECNVTPPRRRLRAQVAVRLRVRGGHRVEDDRRSGPHAVDPRGRTSRSATTTPPARMRSRRRWTATARSRRGSTPAPGRRSSPSGCPRQKTGFGIEYGLGLVDTPYNDVPNIRIENGEADPMIRIGWYRSVNQHPALVRDERLRA